MIIKYIVLLCFISSFALAQRGLVSNAFGNHMVLQRAPEQSRIFGWVSTDATQVINVYLNNVVVATVTSSPNREWYADLPATPAGGPHKIVVTASVSGSVTLEDVYFGDVFVCSGQSNMQFTVNECFNATEEIKEANQYPYIRVFTVGQATTADSPLEEFRTITQGWSVGSSASVGGPSYVYFSALCWFTAQRIYDQEKIPVGVISSNWGGTYIQTWMSPNTLKKCGAEISSRNSGISKTDLAIHNETVKLESRVNYSPLLSSLNKLSDPNRPSVLYNAMIYPLRLMKIRGAFWYQGESNVGNPTFYSCAQTAMIQDWAALFNLKSLQFTFFFIQLSPWEAGPGDSIPDLRQSQLASLQLPYVGFATAADLGDIDAPTGSIHPRDKQTLGLRLGLYIRAVVYGEKDLIYKGPMATGFKTLQQAANKVVVEVEFDPSTLGTGLVMHVADCPRKLRDRPGVCGWYELQRSGDGAWVNATEQEISSDRKLLHIGSSAWEAGRTVEGVRYGYATWPVCTLYNKEGLPAIPFSLKKSVV